MTEHQASRTLLKSPPELWTECSDAQSLARHLGEFGEIRITRLEPERTVAWEGERASGTVTLEPSGWGTKVTLTARTEAAEPEPVDVAPPDPPEPEVPAVAPDPPAVVAEPEPHPQPPARRPGFVARMRHWFVQEESAPAPVTPAPAVTMPAPVSTPPPPEPVAVETPAPPPPAEPSQAEIALTGALESLGKAHHRPFSRS